MTYSIKTLDSLFIENNLDKLWNLLRQEWLNTSLQISGSKHTYEAYETSSRLWLNFLKEINILPWEVTAYHVREWQRSLRLKGNSSATINQRLACVSSFYRFVIREVHLVNGIEYTAFVDASGKTRQNPFQVGNIKRDKIEKYGKANPLSLSDLHKLFSYLDSRKNTLTGSRNLALITTYFLTAARNSEILRLRWGDIRQNSSRTGYVFSWRGKGNKTDISVLPKRAFDSIKNHLEIADRWEPNPNDYIWIPLVTHGKKNLSSFRDHREERKYISEKNSVRILHTSLRLSGVLNPEKYRIHDLRHAFARLYDGDIENLRKILHHESLNTTNIYLRSLEEPTDNYSEKIWNKLSEI